MSETQSLSDRPTIPQGQGTADPLRDVIERMNRARDHIAKADPHLSDTIRLLSERADRPGLMAQENYRTRVAYALMDLEKLAGPVSNMPGGLRQELDRLSTNVSGLQNERLGALMRMTPEIKDNGLVRDIRVTATETAQRDVQNGPVVRDRAEALEGRVRLTHSNAASLQGDRQSAIDNNQGAAPRPFPDNNGVKKEVQTANLSNKQAPDRAKPELPLNNAEGEGYKTSNLRSVAGAGVVSAIVSAIQNRSQNNASSRSLDPMPTPLEDRVTAYEQRLRDGREENSFRGAEQSGRLAAEALQSFANGPGAAVMNRIRDAAKTDPSGLAGVMSEMRAGGIYADLRTQFDGAMQREKGFAAAYERATTATGQYAKDRTAVDDIAKQRPDVEAVTSRFQKLDSQIGAAVAETPGRKEGTSALEDMAAKAAEIVSRAVDRIRAAFSPAARTGSGASPSP